MSDLELYLKTKVLIYDLKINFKLYFTAFFFFFIQGNNFVSLNF